MTELTTTLAERLAIRDQLKTVLVEASKERGQRQEMIPLPDGPIPAWVHHERYAMLVHVNLLRVSRGLRPVKVHAIERVESQAVGHSDYVDQFALYCAEIVMDSSQ